MRNWDTVQAESRLLTGVRILRRRLTTAAGESWIRNRFDTGQQALGRAATHSRIGAVGRTLGRWARGSWLYRWLTKDPDPDVIVIDLRETWTIGPLLAGIDRLATATQRLSQRSGVSRALVVGSQGFRTAPVQILGIVAFVAVLVNTLAGTLFGTLGDAGLGLRLILLAVATLATRVDASWDELREGRVAGLLRAIFEPPELPEEADERSEETDDR